LTCTPTNTELDCWLYVIRTFIVASHAEVAHGIYERLSKQQFVEYYALLPVVVCYIMDIYKGFGLRP
jgi:hypothetical protein